MIDYKQLFIEALKDNNNHPKWNEGDFIGIKILPNTKVGSVGQDFIESLCVEIGFECQFPLNKKKTRASQSPWDIQIEGVKFELKTATEDTGGNYQFNHIRYHREYDAVLCLGVSPGSLRFFMASKSDIATGKAGHLATMEKGANASYKLTKHQNNTYPIEDFDIMMLEFTENFKH